MSEGGGGENEKEKGEKTSERMGERVREGENKYLQTGKSS